MSEGEKRVKVLFKTSKSPGGVGRDRIAETGPEHPNNLAPHTMKKFSRRGG